MRKKVITVSMITAAFLIAIGFAVQGHFRVLQYEQQLENSYTHAFHELTTAVSELDTALQKLQYTNTIPLLHVLCTDIYGKSVAAQMALGELPDSGAFLEHTSTFLARAGDYACTLAHSATMGDILTDHTKNTLHKLAQTSSFLSASLLDLQSDLAGGSVTIEEMIHTEKTIDQLTGKSEADPGGTSFQTIEAEFPEIPTLIYDGPFSEHLSNKTPLAVKDLPHTSRDEARATAAAFLGLRPEVLAPTGQGEGVLPTWSFTAAVDGGELYIEVTQQGCQVLFLFSSRTAMEPTISADTAIEIAKEFLAAHEYHNMQESYYIDQGNSLAINFAPVQQNVLCYPDLVKVSVALDTGAIVGFESHGWIMNHTDRQFATPLIDKDTAAQSVSPALNIISHQLANIPTQGEYEVLCHEFKCRTEQDTNIIVYINASTGHEEKILLLLEDEHGTLAW